MNTTSGEILYNFLLCLTFYLVECSRAISIVILYVILKLIQNIKFDGEKNIMLDNIKKGVEWKRWENAVFLVPGYS